MKVIFKVLLTACVASSAAAVTYYATKKKYVQLAREEINEYKEQAAKHSAVEVKTDISIKDSDTSNKSSEETKLASDVVEYEKEIIKNNYIRYEDMSDSKNIEYIDPDNFGDNPEYDTVTYTYYTNGILTDENDDPVDNFVESVGNFTTHFGDYESDSVFVKNNKLKLYFEILRVYHDYTANPEE